MGNLLTVNEYAKKRGVSASMIRQFIGSEKIKEGAEKNERGWWLIDPKIANKELKKNLDPSYLQKQKKPKRSPKKNEGSQPGYNESKAQKEYYSAQLKKIELRKQQGLFISADDVETAAFERGRKIRDAILNIPDRIAAIVAAESDEIRCREIIKDEIIIAIKGVINA